MEYFFIFLKGFAMGAANVIPGVSGGTIAFITGVYERLIDSLKSFNFKALRLLFKGDFGGLAKHIDLGFLVALSLGVVVSIITLAKILKTAYVDHPTLVNAFFFGLILASLFYVGKMVRRWGFVEIICISIGVVVAVFLAFQSPAGENSNTLYLGACGVAGMCSMIIPGISGSFILLLMGNYQLIVLDAVDNLRQLKLAEALPILIPVAIGAAIGLFTLSHILSWMFKRYHNAAVALITGFVAGSLAIIWPWKIPVYSLIITGKVVAWNRYFPDFGKSSTWIAVAWLVGGIVIISITEKLASKPDA
ncbi:MAG: DUF368 domain-containing protein [Akkermansiaceae bacterium]|nr:DUF368 domain-containing protein [Akkermansiaceae bacterium]